MFYFLAVIAGFLPYGGILLIAIRNLTSPLLLMFNAIHLAIYGAALYWLSGLIYRLLVKVARDHVWLATVAVLLLLAGVGLLPIFGAGHGQVHWTSAYALYRSDVLR